MLKDFAKGSIDLVTAADVACEDKNREELLRVFPDYPVIGEDAGENPSRDNHTGSSILSVELATSPSNIPLYCHNIALVENGEVTVAAVGVGKSEEILFAEKGSGGGFEQRITNEGFQCPTAARRSGIDGGPRAADVFASSHSLEALVRVDVLDNTLSCAPGRRRIAGLLHLGPARIARAGSVHFAAGCLVASEAGAVVLDRRKRGSPGTLLHTFVPPLAIDNRRCKES
jgi:3'-phosphoadenosine 5'-phosphosulfate (PAPS) 3'-phosphatase